MMQFESGEEVELVLKTQKESQTGIFSNERLLMIKAGIISYFSSVPPKFGGSARAIELSGQMPKFTIPANDVDQMELKGNTLSLLFRKAKLISKEDFTRLVSDGQKSEKTPSLSLREQNNGYEKWIFKCQNIEMMQQFYYLANLFRSKNPRFTPNLHALLSSFQTGKKSKTRQMSMNPNQTKNKPTAQQRMTDVPMANSGRDSLTETFIREEAQREVKPVDVKINARPLSGRISMPQPYNQEAQKINQEKERLLRVKNKIQSANQPNMGIIDEKYDEDKISEMSRVKDSILTSKIEIKHTYSMIVDQKEEKKGEKIVEIKEEKREEKHVQPTVTVEPKKIEEPIVPVAEIKKQQQVKEVLPQEEPKANIVEVEKQVQVQEIVVDLNTPDPEPQSNNQQNLNQSPLEIISPSQPLPSIPQNHRPMRKKKQIDQSFNSSFCDSEYRYNEQIKHRQRKKISHLLRSSLVNNPNIFPQLSKQYNVSQEQLQQLMKEYSNEEDSCWNYIENTLSLLLAQQNVESLSNGKKLAVSDGLIEHYHKLGDDAADTENDEFSPLQGEMSFESYVDSNEDEQEALLWMEGEILSHNPRPFSSKILNKSHFKIQIKAISFKQIDLICVKNGWILNKNGKLQEFLAYLRLQKVLKGIRAGLKGEIELNCAQTIYLKFKQYEGLAKQWRMDSSCSPLKSIKALQFIHRCKDMKIFSKEYPQFTIIAQTIRQGHSYRLHLDRISNATIVHPLQRELKRIVFPYDNEIDEFYSTPQYKDIQKRCLIEIDKLFAAKTKIQEGDLQVYIHSLNNNLQVDTLCKILGCRIDRKGVIYFHPTVLRLGGRQFGQEIALIRRSRKKGSFEVAREVSKKVMSRLQYYRNVTPMSHFIQINLELVDLMVVEHGELHRAVPILLKVLGHLNGCEVEQYSVYLSLMKTFLKLNELSNFVKTLQNCRLFLSLMFKQNALIFDYSFQRTIIVLLMHQDTYRAQQLNLSLLIQLKQSTQLNDIARKKLVSKIEWDRSNILMSQGRVEQAFNCCESYLLVLEENVNYIQDYWVQGVLCLARGWLEMETPSTKSTAHLQKRLLIALEYAFSRQNTEIMFILYHTGEKILQKCQELSLPCLLQYQPSYEQARIQFNEVQSELLRLVQSS